ncbi:hypothetical protein [Paracoccus sp. 08]|uniref:hypothetical protein n=1 Tax=Paracoccus sp. 08 TaxID=2606624 RepID=UPI00209543E6|nr:hypothetical protein [Paracoccus sp. 08]MCO6364665.1 hypothetical protein [Paracoccus sp. 08]
MPIAQILQKMSLMPMQFGRSTTATLVSNAALLQVGLTTFLATGSVASAVSQLAGSDLFRSWQASPEFPEAGWYFSMNCFLKKEMQNW